MHPIAKKYLRPGTLPTPFCPGCGNMIVGRAVLEAIDQLHIDFTQCVFVSGIGCAAWIPSPHFNTDTIHTPHGRAIAVATGVKLVRPELHVFVVSGDGDIAGIGGNHLLHAARRNIGIKVVMVNNMLYGMTGGQVGPTTPHMVKTVTTPFGNPEHPLDACRVVAAAGAVYVARWTVWHYPQLLQSLIKAFQKQGFTFVEVLTPCPTQFGRRIGISDPYELLKWIRDHTTPLEKYQQLPPEERSQYWPIGEYVDIDASDYSQVYRSFVQQFVKRS